MATKQLHSFVITLPKEVEEVTVTEENGQKVTRSGKVTKQVDHTIILKEPSRREKSELGLFQNVTYSRAITNGLLPKLVMQQKIAKADPTSSLSEDEDKNLDAVNARLREIGAEYVRINIAAKDEKDESEETRLRRERLATEYLVLQKKAIEINAAYQTVFAHTAENHTQSETLKWLTLFLTYVKVGEEQRPLFTGADFAAKENHSIDMEEAGDPLYTKLLEPDPRTGLPRLSAYWMLYLFNRASSAADFAKIEEEWTKQHEAERKMREEAEKAALEDKAEGKPAEPSIEAVATPQNAPSAPAAVVDPAPEPSATV